MNDVNRPSRGIVFIFCEGPQTRPRDVECLRAAMAAARSVTGLPICLYATSTIVSAVGESADILIQAHDDDFTTPRLTMSRWAPFDQWLYLDHDAKVVGADWQFGFDVLDHGFDIALCGIMGEADKTCLGDSSLFARTQNVFPGIPRWAFYPQLGVLYARRSDSLTRFEDHWLSTQAEYGASFRRQQPSFAVTYLRHGADLRLYLLPPHFNYREGYREATEQGELPQRPRPRGEIQIVHDKSWFNDQAPEPPRR